MSVCRCDIYDSTGVNAVYILRLLENHDFVCPNRLSNDNSVQPVQQLLHAISVKCDDLLLKTLEFLLRLYGSDNILNISYREPLPLHCACIFKKEKTTRLLLLSGVDPNQLDISSKPAILYAAANNSECLSILLNSGANATLNYKGNTALHYAARFGILKNCKLLLESGANVNAENCINKTPLEYATNVEIVRLLLNYNAIYTLDLNKNRVARQNNASGLTVPENNIKVLLECILPTFSLAEQKEWLSGDVIRAPLSLKAQDGHAIRKNLGERYLPPLVESLELPEDLKRYLPYEI